MLFASWTAAAGLYGRALDLCSPHDPRRPALLARAGQASFNADGSGMELLAEAINALLDTGDPELAAETATFAARAEWQRGNRDAAYAFADRAVEIVRDRPASRAKAVALARRAFFHSATAEYPQGLALGREALAVADQGGVDEVRARVLVVLGTTRAVIGDAGGIDDLETAVQLALQAHHYSTVLSGLNNLAEAQRQLGQWGKEAEALEQLRDSTLRYGTSHERRWMHAVYAANLYTGGDWDRALREADEVTASDDVGAAYSETIARCARASIWLARDEVARADRETELTVKAAQNAKDVQVLGPALATRARITLAAGRRDEASSLAAQVARMEPATALLSENQLLVDFVLLLDELEMGEDLTRVLDALPVAWPWTRAGRAAASGDFVAAADIFTGSGHPLWEAMLRLRAGRALTDQARYAEAKEQVARSLEFFRPVGATRYVREGEALAKPREPAT
jgi:tetratricopeptide (TPR) repeat protein